ncbi:BTB/POZ domain-containing protein 6-like isoform X3 [Anopheles aquasalis]|uniref:BTB/POZ domain-containing protein 6-like isoform X3 n=1 Tax=Anopheles aquasalis TaxID=42839 RepID=UPI00215AA7A2|nr:BTB/POZ domain-containing protein 6-like isoform X3 [Anopheles aquasalis]XP_050099487.1 BTB/POZ domain-containing protein 6-like isoform X3 [Anopheles aquasalis]XP_050099488.1 BTB/POZ domain-containing protein 6-like isoform X3 [Anopheles aquasalis]XP_050099489.1 BTB/POZ domain-containing protein 6-like isoform X3 [Anopheles aquasalis]XP_050099490.1 BTB/POZ domain-containing protein 6-like isoform X3 [Anopheles aquasalis]XP_050099491.1 BTB/POZ domain-containing protein 6-like isoform X3 [An
MNPSKTNASSSAVAAVGTAASTGPTDATSAAEKYRSLAKFTANNTILERRSKLLNNPLLSDVMLLVGQSRTPIYGHMALLVAGSQYFLDLLNRDFAKSQKREISLEQVDPEDFLLLLRFIYGAEFEITFENLPTLYDLSHRFIVPDLQVALLKFLEDHTCLDKILKVMKVTRLLASIDETCLGEISSIDEICLGDISNNPLYFFKHNDFITIDKELLVTIFRRQHINCSDDQLASALGVWLQHNTTAEEDARQLHDLIQTGKRSADSFKLHLFGFHRRVLRGEDAGDFIFKINAATRISLYGIGVYVQSDELVVNIEVKVYESEVEIANEQYKFANKQCGEVNVADLFFEELHMAPRIQYRISVVVTPPLGDKAFVLQYPRTHHTSIELNITTSFLAIDPIGLKYLYCKEQPNNE